MQGSNLPELQSFLSEFAVHMLAEGVTATQFQSAVQTAYVHAALRVARLQNSRVNQSAVAAVTGLSRHQVRSLLRTAKDDNESPVGRIERLRAAWISDSEFIDDEGHPRELPLRSGRGSFAHLANKYAVDVSRPALLSEMIRRGMIERTMGRVRLLDRSQEASSNEAIRSLIAGLAMAVRRDASNPIGTVRVVTAEAQITEPLGSGRLLLDRRIDQGCRALISDIKTAADSLISNQKQVSRSKKVSARSVRARVLIVTMD